MPIDGHDKENHRHRWRQMGDVPIVANNRHMHAREMTVAATLVGRFGRLGKMASGTGQTIEKCCCQTSNDVGIAGQSA